MSFKLESEMIPFLEQNIEKILKHKSNEQLVVSKELPVNYRMIDFAIAVIDYDKRLKEGHYKTALKRISMEELDVLSNFYSHKKQKGKVTIQYLKKRLRMSPQVIKEIYLDKFIKLGLIEKISPYSYAPTGWGDFEVKSVVAIEAKLSKWHEALLQAKDNLTFADYSYVALDADTRITEEIKEEFFIANIGIIAVNGNGSINIIQKPKKNKIFNESDYKLQRIRLCRDLLCENSKWYIM
ncbi:hypothetical protein [Bacillus thuringiensis]|jgi:hypothetical protein|uniref:hypothetical protein n=1 Tax=Bacillus thuringiensis TaxID=1428 RepID=UPI001580F426|nr:hypothetical protein [Bacillus thuringiensis]NUH89944.1 hypothetical protein [Bacillus thuringiensis]NUH95770.1 hypothetical protein [Bacillus thuringiensis]NUI00428.1 hypothetical protein [Bacillus thuringiensis]NUI05910.1 hypothetical protein [Bacillus thuringiensis]NUI13866.1 hypothetical protein [Bacillus thuringiensis]